MGVNSPSTGEVDCCGRQLGRRGGVTAGQSASHALTQNSKIIAFFLDKSTLSGFVIADLH